MTATIAPPSNAPGVRRLDPQVRLQDYLAALDFYINLLGSQIDVICFAENSGASLQPLVDLAQLRGAVDRVVFPKRENLAYPPAYGRCYGEMTLLERAMDTLGDLPGDIFWKVTGRYRLENLSEMVASRNPSWDVYCDLRRKREQCWADLRVMSWSRNGFEQVMRNMAPLLREDVRAGRPGEEAAFEVIRQRVANGLVKAQLFFRREPRINGIRAYDEQNWASGRQRLVYQLRAWQRRLLGRVIA